MLFRRASVSRWFWLCIGPAQLKQAATYTSAQQRNQEFALYPSLSFIHLPNSADHEYGRTALSRAAEKGHGDVVNTLIEFHADVNAVDAGSGRTAPSMAAEAGHDTIVELLVDRGAQIDQIDFRFQTPLLYAARGGHSPIVRRLLQRQAKVDHRDARGGRTALSWAAGNGHLDSAKILLQFGASLNSQDDMGCTPLAWAAREGHDGVLCFLLDFGADVYAEDAEGHTALFWAAANGHGAAAKLLVEKYALDGKRLAVNESRSIVMAAAKNAHDEVFGVLLAEDVAPVNCHDANGRTMLSHVSDSANTRIVKLLLDKGAEVNSPDDLGRTPLSYAVNLGCTESVKLLLEHDADPNYSDKDGRSPLSAETLTNPERCFVGISMNAVVLASARRIYQVVCGWSRALALTRLLVILARALLL
ncbi:hypothetical protein NHJ13051_003837 [Beauveria bassiana]